MLKYVTEKIEDEHSDLIAFGGGTHHKNNTILRGFFFWSYLDLGGVIIKANAIKACKRRGFCDFEKIIVAHNLMADWVFVVDMIEESGLKMNVASFEGNKAEESKLLFFHQ